MGELLYEDQSVVCSWQIDAEIDLIIEIQSSTESPPNVNVR